MSARQRLEKLEQLYKAPAETSKTGRLIMIIGGALEVPPSTISELLLRQQIELGPDDAVYRLPLQDVALAIDDMHPRTQLRDFIAQSLVSDYRRRFGEPGMAVIHAYGKEVAKKVRPGMTFKEFLSTVVDGRDWLTRTGADTAGMSDAEVAGKVSKMIDTIEGAIA
jgi:hypothetical protein